MDFALTQDPPQFPECEEGDKGDKSHEAPGEQLIPAFAHERLKASR
jgi:hypothetical protein